MVRVPILIRMYFDDRAPPHFDAAYGEAYARVRILPVGRLDGTMPALILAPPRVRGLWLSARNTLAEPTRQPCPSRLARFLCFMALPLRGFC